MPEWHLGGCWSAVVGVLSAGGSVHLRAAGIEGGASRLCESCRNKERQRSWLQQTTDSVLLFLQSVRILKPSRIFALPDTMHRPGPVRSLQSIRFTRLFKHPHHHCVKFIALRSKQRHYLKNIQSLMNMPCYWLRSYFIAGWCAG
jgi:hypothetical protein